MKLISADKKPCNAAIYEGTNDRGEKIWLVSDERKLQKIDARATVLSSFTARDAVPLRTDIPRDNPFYGRRFLKVVPAGSPDLEVLDDGSIVPRVPYAKEESDDENIIVSGELVVGEPR